MANTGPDYSDVESMLFRGFLSLPIAIEGKTLILKSLNFQELSYIQDLSYDEDPLIQEEKRQLYFILYSLYMVEGTNVLSRREEVLTSIKPMIAAWPESLRRRLLVTTHILQTRASKQIHYVQPYTYGPLSRQKWYSFQNMLLCDPQITGIPGTQVLGLNMQQSLWVAINRMQDVKENFERDWDLAKFMASPHSKDVKKIDNNDRQSREEEKERRDLLYKGKGREADSGKQVIRVSDETNEGLMRQMEQAVRGEKDIHDLIVERFEKRIREEKLRAAQERLEKQKAARRWRAEQLKEMEADPRPGLLTLNPSEVQSRIAAQQRERAKLLRTPHTDPRLKHDPYNAPLLKEHWTKEEAPELTSSDLFDERDPWRKT